MTLHDGASKFSLVFLFIGALLSALGAMNLGEYFYLAFIGAMLTVIGTILTAVLSSEKTEEIISLNKEINALSKENSEAIIGGEPGTLYIWLMIDNSGNMCFIVANPNKYPVYELTIQATLIENGAITGSDVRNMGTIIGLGKDPDKLAEANSKPINFNFQPQPPFQVNFNFFARSGHWAESFYISKSHETYFELTNGMTSGEVKIYRKEGNESIKSQFP